MGNPQKQNYLADLILRIARLATYVTVIILSVSNSGWKRIAAIVLAGICLVSLESILIKKFGVNHYDSSRVKE